MSSPKTSPCAASADSAPLLTKNTFRNLEATERRALLRSNVIDIQISGESVATVSRQLITSVSGLAKRTLTADSMNTLVLPGHISADAVLHIVKYFKRICNTKGFFVLPAVDTLLANATLLQACTVLEMPTFNQLVYEGVRKHLNVHCNLNDLSIIIDCPKPHPGLFRDLTQFWAELRFYARLDDEKAFEEWLEQHQKYKKDVDAVREFHMSPEQCRKLGKSGFM